jgi:hypothetical protein
MSTLGLPVQDVVNVQVVMTPTAAAERNFGSLLILGDSDVINTTERLRLYTSLGAIATDFGTSAPEYKAAALYFGQTPQPAVCYVAKWARTAGAGALVGGILSTAQQALSKFTAVTNGACKITIDGAEQTVSALNLSSATNLNGVAAALQAKLTGATVVWDATYQRFIITSSTTGTSSSVSFAAAPSSGTDIRALFRIGATDEGYLVTGVAAESAVDAVTTLANMSADWYGLYIAASTMPNDDAMIAVSEYIEGEGLARIFGITTQATATLDSVSTSDLAARLEALGYKRTFTQYSSKSAYAAASIFGRAFTVNFDGSNTTLTIKFKQEPGVEPETLTASQAKTLRNKNCNVFVKYNNDTNIIQEGVMVNGYFFDEVHGTDWLQNATQTAVWNLLYTSSTKIPQTDAGVNQIRAVISQVMEQGVTNGLIAPGVWNADGFGALKRGDTLSTGYYIYAQPVADQVQADREARIAPVIQCAIKLAGAIHFVDVIINVNR